MRKFGITLGLGLLLSLCLVSPALAANQVTELDIDVALQKDGSAYITQTFSAVTDEGTEFYLDYYDSGYLSITDLQVSDKSGAYAVAEDWDIDASFEEKAGKCGQLSIENGDELCWGITEYGQRTYTVSYVLHDLVGSYDDADGFNYRFVNADLGFFPTDVTLTIRNQDGTPLAENNCSVWAFGFEGEIWFQDGVIRAWTTTSLEGSDNMTILVELAKGLLSPTRVVDDSFQPVKDAAMDGSDYAQYDDEGDLKSALLVIAAAAVLFVLVVAIGYGVQQAKLKKLMNQTPYFRDTPNGGNLNVTYQLCQPLDLCQKGSLLGARLLRLIAQGCLEPASENLDDKEISLRLVHPPHQSGDAYDEALYTILEEAAGEDGVLQPKELGNFSKVHWRTLNTYLESCDRDGLSTLVHQDCLRGATIKNLRSLTQEGRKQLDEVLGLKRFLLDFSLIRERYTGETFLWQDYMVYAMLLGIADNVTQQLRALYPQSLPQVEQYQRQMAWAYSYHHVMYRNMDRQRAAEAARSEGKGGYASSGGGGGFSGGGGGGTR